MKTPGVLLATGVLKTPGVLFVGREQLETGYMYAQAGCREMKGRVLTRKEKEKNVPMSVLTLFSFFSFLSSSAV